MANINSDVTLFDAARKGNLDDLRAILLQGNKYILLKDARGYNIAHVAAEAGMSGVLQWIDKNNLALMNTYTNTGFTPLHIACEFGFLDVLIALKMGKADLNVETIPDKLHGAHLCSRQGHLQCLQFLSSNGAKLNTKDMFGNTPIVIAAHNGQKEIVKFLSETLKIAEKTIPKVENQEDPFNRRLTAPKREAMVKKALEQEKKNQEKGLTKGGTFLDQIQGSS